MHRQKYLYVHTADVEVRPWSICDRWARSAQPKNCIRNKKSEAKALIPLPSTGSASVFCANPDAMKAILQPRPAVGLRRGAAIAQCANLCRKMSAPCTASDRAGQMGANLEGPACLGEKLENRGMRWFSKSTLVSKLRTRASTARSDPTSTTQA